MLGGPHASWLEMPPTAVWPDGDDANPFVRWRRLLWSWHRAQAAGWTDDDFVGIVRDLDRAVAGVDGTGFRVTPTGEWHDVDPRLPRRVVWKDETGNVGGSHKARHLMGLLLHLAVDAVAAPTRLAISSCGNAALGAATVARAAQRPIDVFIPTWADPAIVAALTGLGATIHVCDRQPGEVGDPCMLRFQEAVSDGALPFGVQATENRWTLDGGRTIGWELAAGLAGGDPVERVYVQVGGGALLTSCAIGVLESVALGVLPTAPQVWAVQAEGCAPFDRAWRQIPSEGSIDARLEAAVRSEAMAAWDEPHSAATGILDDITYDWLGIARGLLLTGGDSVVAAEDEILAAATLVPTLGIDADATGTASVAGAMAAVAQGRAGHDDAVAVLVTGRKR